jgi:hypothetical protein
VGAAVGTLARRKQDGVVYISLLFDVEFETVCAAHVPNADKGYVLLVDAPVHAALVVNDTILTSVAVHVYIFDVVDVLPGIHAPDTKLVAEDTGAVLAQLEAVS